MKLLWSYLRRHRRTLFGALFLAAINQVFSLLDPQIFRIIIDRYGSRIGDYTQAEFVGGVLILLALSVGVALVSRIAKSFQDYFVSATTQRVGAALYANSVEHAFSLPFATFEDQRSGELLQKLHKARLDAQTLIQSAVNILFLSVVGMVFVIIYAFTVHPYIGLAYTLMIPALGIVTSLLSRRIREIQTKIVKEVSDLAGSTTETLRNVEIVKSLGLEGQEISRLNDVNAKILGLDMRKIKTVRTLSFLQGTVINALRAGLLFLMLWLIYTGNMTVGELFSLFVYSFFIFSPLAELATVAAQYQEAKASLGLVEDVFKTPPEPQAVQPQEITKLQSVAFKNVGFSYSSDNEETVRNINFTLSEGEKIAFVGPSGSGKSTIVKLLVGLYKPQSGQILFNNLPGAEIDYTSLRKHFGFVSQETQLFAGSIRDNLLFVKPDASDEECLAALRQASALSIVERLPAQAGGDNGLDTKIGEGGIKVSGGERQRLAIARALLRQPSLIIFDEATSSLDSITERAITATIKEVAASRPGLMTVLVAHRLSTVIHADRIFVLERGRIIEAGSHNELVDLGGLYAALWREQSGA